MAMGDDLAASNVNRTYSLSAMCVAIFTFMLIFLYPRYASGEVNGLLFQGTFVVMGVATFSLVFASLQYYGSSLGNGFDEAQKAMYLRRGDRFWLLGYTLLFLVPSLVLVTVGLLVVAAAWFVLWLAYVLFATRFFPRVETRRD
jgi:hypothetical protein